MEHPNRVRGNRLAPRHLLLLSLVGAFAACGPVKSTAVIMDADVQLEAARTAGAEKLAPYEYTAAAQYLHKAREEQGYSDFEVSIDFAEKALKNAIAAKEKAMASKADNMTPTAPPTLVPPPAEQH